MSLCVDRTAEFESLTKTRSAPRPLAGRYARVRSIAAQLLDPLNQVPYEQLYRAALAALRHLERSTRNSDEAAHDCALALLFRKQFDKPPPIVESVPRENVSSEEWQQRALQWLEAPAESRSRARRLGLVHRQLELTSAVYEQIAAQTTMQGYLIDVVEQRVDGMCVTLQRADANLQDAAPRAHRTWRSALRARLVPHTLSGKLRLCLATTISLNALALCIYTTQ